MCVWCDHSVVSDSFVTPCTVALQAPLSMGFPRLENTGVGCHALLPGIFPNPGVDPASPALQADSSPSEPPGKPQWDLFCNNLEGWEWARGGREIQEGRDICTLMVNSC